MCLFVVMYETGSAQSIQTPTGWTSKHNNLNNFVSYACFVKTATADDVSAGSVTISSSGGSDFMAASLHRITGALAHTVSFKSEADDGTFTPSASFTTDLTPDANESLVLVFFGGGDTTLSSTPTASNYSTTPSTTLTEACDLGVENSGSGIGHAVAYADYDGVSKITARAATFNENLDRATPGSIIVIYEAPQDASGTAALLQATPAIFAPTTGGGTSGTAALLSATPTIPAPTSSVQDPTSTNTTKNAGANIVNTTKHG